MASCTERFGDKVDGFIAGNFYSLGTYVGLRPRLTIAIAFLLTVLMGAGFATWETENRPEELWVPQDTIAETETEMYRSHFPSSSRFNQIIFRATSGQNVLTKETVVDAMKVHKDIETKDITVDGKTYILQDICTIAGGSCATSFTRICSCLVNSILKQWDYDLELLQNDTDYMATLNQYGSKEDFEAVLGNPLFDDNGTLVSAEGFSLSYFLQDQSEVIDGSDVDKIGEKWEEEVFLATAESIPELYPSLDVDYFATRSFGDEFGGAISGDLFLVQISYVMAFLFLGANLGKIKCGTGSRWTMALSALMTVG